jgi:hypothetical protein
MRPVAGDPIALRSVVVSLGMRIPRAVFEISSIALGCGDVPVVLMEICVFAEKTTKKNEKTMRMRIGKFLLIGDP